MTFLEAAEKVLRVTGRSMKPDEIVEEAIAKGLLSPSGKTPEDTMDARLSEHIKDGGKVFVRTSPGYYGLADMKPCCSQLDLFEEVQKRRGYVYILTNPYFRKGIVKIGKSGRPVNTRSKELYNTSVPDRFKVYASLSTVKYDAVEKLIHAILTKLTKRRVNDDREFFKIAPADGLDVFRDVATVIDDAEIVVTGEETKPERKKKTTTPPRSTDILYCTGGGADARGRIVKEGFLVLKGSRFSDHVVPSFEKRAHGCHVKRNELIATGLVRKGELIKDVVFTSPTIAACVVQGRNSNGLHDWHDSNGKLLRNLKV